MENPRPEKVAVVDDVKAQIQGADAALLTEYRGINVGDLATLRRALREAGGEYRVYKNTLVRIATRELGLEVDDLLTGPTAIAFVPTGGGGDPVAVAKALREFAKGNPALVVKGGLLGEKLLSADEVKALAEVAPREELLATLAGLMAAPMQSFAGLLQAVPRNFAYGLAALIEQGGAPGAPAPAPADDAPADEAPASDAAPETPAEAPAEAETEADAPAAASDDTAEATAAADTPEPADAGDDPQES
ncbi:50S ribosomal protein L10 [Rhabdothermincola salaria]|uniref:50S ribosomal protein L10 n=1 Tax=Rhabdothermincola salaria TaxID=2903142 RepID=UPI001E4F160A|nr:50S ribosomal protein L10 [Rhabdothermincola salaria]MCD9625758.1 50S ribosomal protein L10 [Rhabdothermincola salaria]